MNREIPVRFCERLGAESPGLLSHVDSRGQVFSVPYPVYHCVVSAEHNTLTLMVRSRPLFVNPHINDSGLEWRDPLDSRRKLEKPRELICPRTPKE
jgi:hypothetical protein